MITKGKRGERKSYLFSHLDHNIRITADDISDGKIHSSQNMNSEQTHQILHCKQRYERLKLFFPLLSFKNTRANAVSENVISQAKSHALIGLLILCINYFIFIAAVTQGLRKLSWLGQWLHPLLKWVKWFWWALEAAWFVTFNLQWFNSRLQSNLVYDI